jgi:hypothetical protein
MSLINDALNKVQQQRKETVTARAIIRYPGSPLPIPPMSRREQAPARTPPYIWVLVNVAVLALLFAGYHFFFRDAAPSPDNTVADSPRPVGEHLEIAATEAHAPDSAIAPSPVSSVREDSSPFAATPSAASEPAPIDSEYDLAGMTVVGKNTLLSITRRSDQKSFWVAVGKTVGEVTAVSYDPQMDNARIRVRGRLVTIVMRNG